MNRVIIEIPEYKDIKIRVKNLDEAIKKLDRLRKSLKSKNSIKRFKGITKSGKTISEEEWYLQ